MCSIYSQLRSDTNQVGVISHRSLLLRTGRRLLRRYSACPLSAFLFFFLSPSRSFDSCSARLASPRPPHHAMENVKRNLLPETRNRGAAPAGRWPDAGVQRRP